MLTRKGKRQWHFPSLFPAHFLVADSSSLDGISSRCKNARNFDPKTFIFNLRSIRILPILLTLLLQAATITNGGETDTSESILGSEIRYSDLKPIDLRYFQGIGCRGSECPEFSSCNSELPLTSTDMSACWNSDAVDDEMIITKLPLNYNGTNSSFDAAIGERFAGQVYLLKNVFINNRGTVFDRTHIYVHAKFCKSCPYDFGTYNAANVNIVQFDELASIAYWNGGNFYHSLFESMPAIMLLKPFLDRNRNLPLAIRDYQVNFMRMFSLVGLPPSRLNTQVIDRNKLFFAKKLLVPAQATCGRPSKAMIQKVRQSIQSIFQRGSSRRWVVVIGLRSRTRQISQWSSLRSRLLHILPVNRTIEFDGRVSLRAAQELFSRCLLFISPHGALLANILFMPSMGEVLEIRPSGFNNPVYHYVSHLCDVSYNVVHGNGTKASYIDVDHDLVIETVTNIMSKYATYFS